MLSYILTNGIDHEMGTEKVLNFDYVIWTGTLSLAQYINAEIFSLTFGGCSEHFLIQVAEYK